MIGKRDRAVLELLARAGLRGSELAGLGLGDVQERGRQPDARRRTAAAPSRGDQTQLEVVIRGSKRGRTRTVPLHAEAHDALRRWYAARPAAATDALLVTFCTMLAERGVTLEVIFELAGHVDVRTAQSYATSATSAKPRASPRSSARHTRSARSDRATLTR